MDRRTGRFSEAESNFKRAVELDPRNFYVLNGSWFDLSRDARDTLRHGVCTEQALNVLPNDPFVSYLLGFNSFARTGNPADLKKPLNVIANRARKLRGGSRFRCCFVAG